MRVRLATAADEEAIVAMARVNTETRPTLVFSEARCRQSFQDYLNHASPTVFVVEDKSGVIGMLICDFYEYRAAAGLWVSQEVLFVRPDKRGLRAAALLVDELIKWAGMLGAREIVGGNDNEFNSDRTARFLGRFGFKRVGHSMRRDM